MPEYHYKAVDMKGHYIDGQTSAENPAELIALLQKSQLLLVAAHTADELNGSPADVETPRASESPAEPVHHLDTASSVSLRTLTWKQGLLLAAVFAGGLSWGFWRTYKNNHPFSEKTMEILNQKLAQLDDTMTRKEIEKIFTARYKTQIPGKTRYWVPPGFVVQMAYDDTGGVGRDQNRPLPDTLRVSTERKIDGKVAPH